MSKFCIVIPAVLDDECIYDSVDSYIKNIIQCNNAEDIRFIIHIDNFQYEGHSGTIESVTKIYEQLKSYVHCDIYCSENRKGLKLSFQFLMEMFLRSGDDFLVYYDDDHRIINPLPFSGCLDDFLDDSRYLVHFADSDIKTSHETPFLLDESVFTNDEIVIRKNNKYFYTQAGAILNRKIILSILDEYRVAAPRSSEKIVGELIFKNVKPTPEVLTVCVNSGVPLKIGAAAPTGKEEGIMRIEDHFSCDGRRWIKNTGKHNQGVFNYG